jgi:hypothetical protein
MIGRRNITLTLRYQTCPTVQVGNFDLPQKNEVKYLDMHLVRRLVWKMNLKRKKTAQPKAKQMHWLFGKRSTLSMESKILL